MKRFKSILFATMWLSLSLHRISTSVTAETLLPIRLRGLNYNTRQGPDWAPDDQRCKSRQQIWTDLTLLHKMTDRIRLLSITDCNQTELVLDVATEIGLQVWLGLWVDEEKKIWLEEISAFEDLVVRGLVNPSVVLGVTVGSEVLLRQDATLAELMEYLSSVRLALATHGAANLPVSIVEISYYYGYYADLRDSVDFLYMNVFPYFFWKDTYNIEGSVDQLIGDASRVLEMSSGASSKRLILGETGWPSDGGRPGLASPEHQAEYFVDFYCQVHLGKPEWDYYYFTGIDNAWRVAQGSNNIEGNWGFFTADLALKSHFRDLEFDCGGGTKYSFGVTDWTVPLPPESCAAHASCEGIDGKCCPTNDGIWLGCCENAPTPSPSASPPTVPPTIGPTIAPTSSPTGIPKSFPSLSMEPPSQSCLAHDACVSEGLQGNCCPTNAINGVWLGCCNDAPTASPTSSPPTKSPTRPPTASPSTASPTRGRAVTDAPGVPAINSPSAAPTAKPSPDPTEPQTPVMIPTKAPSNGTLPTPPSQSMCSVHEACVQRSMQGLCCPTPEGIFLGCCTEQNNNNASRPTADPTMAPVARLTDTPTEAPASSFAAAPIIATTAPTKSPPAVGTEAPKIIRSAPPTTTRPTKTNSGQQQDSIPYPVVTVTPDSAPSLIANAPVFVEEDEQLLEPTALMVETSRPVASVNALASDATGRSTMFWDRFFISRAIMSLSLIAIFLLG